MRSKRSIGVAFILILAVLGVGSAILDKRSAAEGAAVMAPRFEVNPLWPKPLPNHWILGQTIGVSADAQDHIWIIHRGGSLEPGEVHATTKPPIAQCCAPAPPILRIQPGRRPHRSLGRTWARLRLAGVQSRDHGRLQRDRLDRRKRPRTPAWRGRPRTRPARRAR